MSENYAAIGCSADNEALPYEAVIFFIQESNLNPPGNPTHNKKYIAITPNIIGWDTNSHNLEMALRKISSKTSIYGVCEAME